jgi:exonuclease III
LIFIYYRYKCIVGIYTPVEGKDQETEEFYEKLQECLDGINRNEGIILMGDFNARVGNYPVTGHIGSQGEPVTNNNGI